jgi:GNAT superfamily N-acetyltransferase
MALKIDSITTHSHLGPWVAAGFVTKDFRNRGVGASLLTAIEKLAADMEVTKLYSGTARAHGLLLRAGWSKKEIVVYNGEDVSIYQKEL